MLVVVWPWAAVLKFRNLRLPLRHPTLLPFPTQHSKQPGLPRLPIGSPRPQQTLRRALLLDCRLRYPNQLLLLHGSTKRSHRKQMKLPCRRLHRRPHLLLHRRFRRSPQPNAAEQLRWDMEVAASPPPEPVPPPVPAEAVNPSPRIIEMPEPRQQPTAAKLLRQEMAAATPPPGGGDAGGSRPPTGSTTAGARTARCPTTARASTSPS